MSDIKTGLMFSPLTEKVYWGKMNTKTGVSVGNNQKDITSEFIGTMLQKFSINTRQTITTNGKTECVVIVLDEEKANEYTNAKKENAQLKADNAELLSALQDINDHYCELINSGDAGSWNPNDEDVIQLSRKLIQKHKTQ